jgi:hypothetical protein
MTALADRLDSLSTTRAETLDALGGLTEHDLERSVVWRGAPQDLRFLLLQLADADDERRATLAGGLAAAGLSPGGAARALADAAVLRGRTLGAIVGLPYALLDQIPTDGGWSPRAVLQHILANEQRYTIHTHYAALRWARGQQGEPEGPVRVPDGLLPDGVGSGLAQGPLSSVRAELLTAHAATVRILSVLSDGQLTGATVWAGVDTDVRFRLHRFAAHERQHLIHLIKTLRGLQFEQSEAQLILAEAEAARLQLVSVLAGLASDDLARPLGPDRGSALDVLAEVDAGERALVQEIRTALEG